MFYIVWGINKFLVFGGVRKEILMGFFSMVYWLIVLVVVFLFFGCGKILELMGDFVKGI